MREYRYDLQYYDKGIGGFHEASFGKISRQFLHVVGDKALPDVLDMGCGGGFYGRFLRSRAARLEGVDLSEALRKSPNLQYYDAFHHADLGQAWTAPRLYDAVFSVEVVEHVEDYRTFLRNAYAALRPGGTLFLTTTTYFWTLFILVVIYRRQVSPAALIEFMRGWRGDEKARSAFVMHFWEYFTGHYHGFTPRQLRKGAEAAGFCVERIENLHVQPVFPVNYLDQPYHGLYGPAVRLGVPVLRLAGSMINTLCRTLDLNAPNVVMVARKPHRESL